MSLYIGLLNIGYLIFEIIQYYDMIYVIYC